MVFVSLHNKWEKKFSSMKRPRWRNLGFDFRLRLKHRSTLCVSAQCCQSSGNYASTELVLIYFYLLLVASHSFNTAAHFTFERTLWKDILHRHRFSYNSNSFYFSLNRDEDKTCGWSNDKELHYITTVTRNLSKNQKKCGSDINISVTTACD